MQAIILAAGLGLRLGALTRNRPKPLLELNGITLLGRTLNSLLILPEIREIIIVTGYLSYEIETYVHSYYSPTRIRLVYNQDYLKGSAFTVLKAEPYIAGSFLLINADHLFSSKAYRKMIAGTRDITVGSFRNRQPAADEMKLTYGQNGLVTLSKTSENYDCGYTGLSAVSSEVQERYFQALKSLVSSEGSSVVPENLILPLSKSGIRINELDLSEHQFLEIDTPEDYEIAQERVKWIEREDLT